MKGYKIFIATSSFGDGDPSVFKVLKKTGCTHVLNPHRRKLNEGEITGILQEGGYQGLLAGLEPLNSRVFAAVPQLKVISRVGVGLDNVDQKAARSAGIKVYNTPGVLTDAVAELALGLMLDALRKISLQDRRMRAGQWEKHTGGLLKGKVVGIAGFGSIGRRVAQLVQAFGASVIFTDVRKITLPGAKQVVFASLLRSADVISLHSSGTGCLIGDAEIKKLRPGVILVNTARGGLIEEEALFKGLSSGRIACAALDVFTEEPYAGKLLMADNVILTPHIGSYAREARVLMEMMAVENLINGLKGM